MKYNSEKTPIILGISIIFAVLVGLSLILADFFDDLHLQTQEEQENLYSRNEDVNPEEDVETLAAPSQDLRGTANPVESDGSLEINSYSHAPANTGVSRTSYSLSSNSGVDRPIDVFDRSDRQTRSLSSQSLTQSNSFSNPSLSDRPTSSTSSSSESLLNPLEHDDPLDSFDSNSNSFSDRDDSRDNEPFGENSRF